MEAYIFQRAKVLLLAHGTVKSILCTHPFSDHFIKGGGGLEMKYITTFKEANARVRPPMASRHPNVTVWWRHLNEVREGYKYSLQLSMMWLKEHGGIKDGICEADQDRVKIAFDRPES